MRKKDQIRATAPCHARRLRGQVFDTKLFLRSQGSPITGNAERVMPAGYTLDCVDGQIYNGEIALVQIIAEGDTFEVIGTRAAGRHRGRQPGRKPFVIAARADGTMIYFDKDDARFVLVEKPKKTGRDRFGDLADDSADDVYTLPALEVKP